MIKKQSFIFLPLSFLFVSADNLDQPYNLVGYKQEGNASYYAEKFHGRKTASGEFYDMNELTAAHPRIRFNTKIKVTNLNNNKTVIVRINDRGPYTGGRIIDLSQAAAKKLDMIKAGVVPVKTEVIATAEQPVLVKKEEKENKPVETVRKTEEKQTTNKKKTKVGRLLDRVFNNRKPEPQKQEKPKQEESKKDTKPVEQQTPVQQEEKPIASENKDNPSNTSEKRKGGVLDKPERQVKPKTNEEKFAGVSTYSIWGTVKYPNGFGVQIGSFTILDIALEKAKGVYEKGYNDVFIQTGWAGERRVYRILVGEGSSETVAALIPKLRASGYAGGFVKQHY
jgi:rare lipoprotein A